MHITHMFLISASASEIWVVNEQEEECKHIRMGEGEIVRNGFPFLMHEK